MTKLPTREATLETRPMGDNGPTVPDILHAKSGGPFGSTEARPEPGSPSATPVGHSSAFLAGAGLVLDEVTGSRVGGHIDLGRQHHTPWGVVHGGVYTTAVESAASVGASAAVQDRGMVAVGLTNTTHFLRSLTSGTVTVESVALHQGRTQQLWRVDIVDGDGRLVAHGEVRLQNVDGARP